MYVKPTCVRPHGEVGRVVLPRLEVRGVLHRAVAARRHPSRGAVNQGAPLRQEGVRGSEVAAFHSDRLRPINPKSKGRSEKEKIRRHRRYFFQAP